MCSGGNTCILIFLLSWSVCVKERFRERERERERERLLVEFSSALQTADVLFEVCTYIAPSTDVLLTMGLAMIKNLQCINFVLVNLHILKEQMCEIKILLICESKSQIACTIIIYHNLDYM